MHRARLITSSRLGNAKVAAWIPDHFLRAYNAVELFRADEAAFHRSLAQCPPTDPSEATLAMR